MKRLDIRQKKIADPTALARLTSMPNFRDIDVAQTPFCITHPSYRITIFNLFRRTPGYIEDVAIDLAGPNHSERLYLAGS